MRWINPLTIDCLLDAFGGCAPRGDPAMPSLGVNRSPRAEIEARDVPIDGQWQHGQAKEIAYDIVAGKPAHRAGMLT